MAITVLTRVTRYGTPDPRAPVSARWAPLRSLLSELTRAPIWVRVKNATGIRCTWSKRDGQSMLLTEQNVRKALVVSDYAYVMAEGRIALEGACRRVSGREEVQRAFLGM